MLILELAVGLPILPHSDESHKMLTAMVTVAFVLYLFVILTIHCILFSFRLVTSCQKLTENITNLFEEDSFFA